MLTLSLLASLTNLTPPAVLKAVSVVTLAITASIRLWQHGVLNPVERKIGEKS